MVIAAKASTAYRGDRASAKKRNAVRERFPLVVRDMEMLQDKLISLLHGILHHN